MPEPIDDPRTYFAAERTFLAWIRTGLALMGIGFAVARFGLFLHELHLNGGKAHSTGLSLYSGVALVALGVLVNVFAVTHHVRTNHALRSGTWKPQVAYGAVALAAILAVVGVGIGVYLVVLR